MQINGKPRLDILDKELDMVELYFKRCWQKYPERHFDIPSNVEDTKDITDRVNWKTIDRINMLSSEEASSISDNAFDENSFFLQRQNVSFVRHPRYLPSFWHSHEFFELLFVIDGFCYNHICNQKLRLNAGDICLMAPGTVHAVSAFSDQSIILNITIRNSILDKSFIGLMSEEDILSNFFKHAFYDTNKLPYLIFHTKDDALLKQYIRTAYKEHLGNASYKSQMVDSLISIFFIVLLRNHKEDMELPVLSVKSSDEVTMHILQYMQTHYTTVSLQELVEIFHYSKRQTERIIQNATGMTFTENIQAQKIARAKELLTHSNFSITKICELTGFHSQNNFRHLFYKKTAMTPSDYRRKNLL